VIAVRVPAEVRAGYIKWAAEETRSMSQQVVHVLRQALAARTAALKPPRTRAAAKKGAK
jgi:hypothetical protein